MKLPFTRLNVRVVIALGISAGVLMGLPSGATATSLKKEDPAKKNSFKAKSFVSRNKNAVRIYPAIFKKDMYVVAKNKDGREIDFFVFDLQGTLVQNYKMKAKARYRMINMERGSYIYRVFCGDEETASGTFEIR